jgi:hypothetical protein
MLCSWWRLRYDILSNTLYNNNNNLIIITRASKAVINVAGYLKEGDADGL